jgi:hypothetical protein
MGTGDGDQQSDQGSEQLETASIKNLLDLKECVEDSPSFR